MPINPSPAVRRACDVLELLAQRPEEPLSLSEIARRIRAPRATCDAVLLSLGDAGFVVRRDDDLRYALGSACIAIGSAARTANGVMDAAAAEAEQLARQTSSFVALATRDGDDVRVADVFDHGPPFGIRAHAGQSIPNVPPFGAVFTAWDTDDAVQRWLDHPDLAATDDRVAHYRAALAAVRDRGFSVTTATPRRDGLVAALETLSVRPDADDARRTRDEVMREMVQSEYLPAGLADDVTLRVSQLSAPVFDRAGRVATAIMMLGPNYDVTNTEITLLGEVLVAAATRATRRVGGRAPEGRA
jgi:DNA-binding IclR family transcriptional regulator